MTIFVIALALALQTETPASDAAATDKTEDLQLVEVVRPTMPRAAERRSITGYVVVRYSVSEDGRVEDLEVLDSEPRGIFDRPALRAVSQWRYEPPGRRVDDVEIRFDFG
jgi:TonB family protein